MLRLLRLAKLKRIVITIEDYIASTTVANVFLLLRLLFVVFLLAHWTACLWFFVSSGEMMTGKRTWVGQLHAESAFEMYVTAVYFSFATMTTVGYGDVHPYTRTESIFAIFTMILASGEFAYTVGSISSLLSKSTAEENDYRLRVTVVKRFMRKKGVPAHTQMRVRRYLEYVWDRQHSLLLREKEIVERLSTALREEIYSYVHGSILNTCEAFRSFDISLVASLSKLVESETFAPSDVVFQEGERSTKIYFLDYGSVQIYHQASGAQYAVLQNGAYFGEIAFFLETQRCAAASCLSFVDLLSLSRSHLVTASDKYPETKEILQSYLGKCVNGDLSLLEVRCYVCSKLGHVASVCGKLALDSYFEARRLKRLCRHSKLIPCDRRYKSNFARVLRPRVKVDYKARNVIGIPSSVSELFGKDSPFVRLVRDFEADSGLQNSTSMQSARPQDCDLHPGKRDLSSIVDFEDEQPEPLRTAVRRKTFRRSLIRRTPLLVEQIQETPAFTSIENLPVEETLIPSARETDVEKGTKITEYGSKIFDTGEFSFREWPDNRRKPPTIAFSLGLNND